MEIGSEFWKINTQYISENEEWFLSGRTALDIIIKDALNEKEIKSALLPSYCCHSMIEPFIKNKITVRFYDVFIDKDGKFSADIPEPKKQEIFYDMKYFGNISLHYANENTLNIKKQWDLIIEDTTHTCFHKNYSSEADYEFSSFRKWMALDGIARARKKNGVFSVKPFDWLINDDYCTKRNQAFEMKANYILKNNIKKNDYLILFEQAEKQLETKYFNFRPDINTIIYFFNELKNIDDFRKKRFDNAQFLINKLKDINGISVPLDEADKQLCPLFVPIIVEDSIRNPLQQYLKQKEIYCPMHWPLSKAHQNISFRAKEIYQRELSLICDQRYNDKDMERIINEIKNFYIERKN